ncbi:AI-2E family transporter [Archangium primigenium]|uniref:AI-2E family transporter n=1 Tax=[Archangium] primigenium TaxID=2792470 RepID=UPI00195CBBF9|nr:AI-2E family transporter [Archangium primigenium]MBM7113059.1 AI-2E family transporter [Archangium primigenium]
MPSPRRSQVTPLTVWTVGLHALALVTLLWLLTQSAMVLSWVMVSLFLALAANPLVSWLEARGLRRGLAVLGVALLGLGLLSALVVTLVPMLVEQGRALVQAAPGFLDRLQHHPWVEKLDKRYDVIDQAAQQLQRQVSGMPGPMLGVVTDVLRNVVAAVTVAVLTVFFLLFGDDLFQALLRWVRPTQRERYARIGHRMKGVVGGYVAGSFLISLIGGITTAVITLVLGVPYFLPLGLMMTVLGLIPFVGTFLGGILVTSTTMASVGMKQGLIALALFVVYQQVESNLLQPLVQRHTLKMNPLIIALVMLVGTGLAGLLGALLSLPIAGALQVLMQERLARLHERWAFEESSGEGVILQPHDEGPRDPPPSQPPSISH